MIADIASGNTDAADVLFLIASIVAVVAAILYVLAPTRTDTATVAHRTYAFPALCVAVALLAFGWVLL